MAHYDPNQDKIYGVKRGTLTYYHEMGHRELHKNGTDTKIDGLIYIYILLFLTFSTFKLHFLMLVTIISIWVLFFAQESYAWIFAFKKMRVVECQIMKK